MKLVVTAWIARANATVGRSRPRGDSVSSSTYVIRGGLEGRERLRVLARVMWPTTRNIGPRLPGLLRDAGLDDIAMNVVQPAGFSGEVKLIAPITMEAVADAMVAADVATSEDVVQTIDELYAFTNTEGTVQSLPRVVQTWGRRVS
jgi:hypothetical protein